jgi:hypothetical protein
MANRTAGIVVLQAERKETVPGLAGISTILGLGELEQATNIKATEAAPHKAPNRMICITRLT